MLAVSAVVFREIFEIALILTIVLASTNGLKNRLYMVLAGLGLGAMGSAIIAIFIDSISNAVDGVGLEIFNAIIMFIAVFFLSWTVIWMKRHGKEIADNMKKTGQDIVSGKKHYFVLIAVIAFASFREGAEIVLFTYGMVLSEKFSSLTILTGALIGAVGGALVGYLLYIGLLKTVKKHLFTVTSWMLIIITGGIAAQGAGFLISANILPAITNEVWDSSALVSAESLLGKILSVLIGYTPKPSGMELIFYFGVIFIISYFYLSSSKKKAVLG
jgi:high-affinity iron transporter